MNKSIFENNYSIDDTLFDLIEVIALVIDSSDCIVRWNKAAENFTGLKFEDIRGIPYAWERFIPNEELPKINDVFRHIKNHTVPKTVINHWINSHGEPRLF